MHDPGDGARILGRLGAVFLLWATLGSCDGERSVREEASRGGIAVVVSAANLDAANPLVTSSIYMQEVNRHLLFAPLLRYDDRLDLVPHLAESWRREADTAAVFQLRRDVRWTDGTPTTAYDAAFTFRRALDPEVAYPNAGAFSRWRAVEALDSFTLRVSYDPHPEPLGGVPLLPVLPAHALDTVPPDGLRNAAFNRAPVTNGPFRLLSMRSGDRWVFGRNDGFPEALGGPPRLDRLVWRVVPESQAQVAELLTGEAHMALEPRAARFDSLSALPGLRGLERPSLRYSFIGWNGRREPFDDTRVRRALGLALDRREILEALRGGHGHLAVGPVPPAHWAHATSLAPLPHDPAAARRLLADAGFRDSDGDGVLEGEGGSDFRFGLLLPAGSDLNRDLAQKIQADLAEVGVAMELRPLEFATLVGTVSDPARRFDAVLLALDADLRLDLRPLFHSSAVESSPFQLAGYADPALDRLLDRVATEPERERARQLWLDIQRILADEQPWTFLYYYPELILVSERLEGVEMDVRGVLLSAPRWHLTALR